MTSAKGAIAPSSQHHRTRLARVELQLNAMDCGPASLACLLAGYGRRADVDALRDLCSTDVDGTSIDALTSLACELGLRARQLMVPPDHLRSPGLDLLPLIAVTELPGGLLHFVVVWRRIGGLFELMDPAVGRRWLRWEELEPLLYRHSKVVKAEAWRAYAGTDSFLTPLREHLLDLGLTAADIEDRLATATAPEGWEDIAELDARARAARSSAGLDTVTPAERHCMGDCRVIW